jgi:hypothetical protein
MMFETCPFCAGAVHVFHFPGGWLLIACGTCDAQWESHSGSIRRINDGERFGAAQSRPVPEAPTRLIWAEVECPTCGDGTERRSVVEYRDELWVMCGVHGMQQVDPDANDVTTSWPGELIPRSATDSSDS